MALTKLTDLLEDAKDGQYAVGMFVMYNVEFLQGLIQAAEEMKSPIFIAYGELAEDVSSIKHFSKTVLSMIEDAKVPIGFHWDHASSLDVVKLAVESGFTSVMIDASAHPLEENIRITKEVVEYCKPLGIPVEGELGCVGQGANYDPEKYIYTDPQEAMRFVKETGIDALAVAIGNSHGVYACKPKLNFEVLKEIRDSVDVPLVLHGASGIPDEDIRKAICQGITKVNIYTDMCSMAIGNIKETMNHEKVSLEMISKDMTNGCKKIAEEKIKLFMSENKAN